MALEQLRGLGRVLLVGATVGAFGACTTLSRTSIRTTGIGVEEGVRRWRAQASPEDQAVIDELLERKGLLIHVILGRISDRDSRGGATGFASGSMAKSVCLFHPKVDGVLPQQDWDVIYDRELAEKFEKWFGIPTPIEVVIHHEIAGHIVPVLRDPDLVKRIEGDWGLRMANEREALAIENAYRRRLGLPEVPPELVGLPEP